LAVLTSRQRPASGAAERRPRRLAFSCACGWWVSAATPHLSLAQVKEKSLEPLPEKISPLATICRRRRRAIRSRSFVGNSAIPEGPIIDRGFAPTRDPGRAVNVSGFALIKHPAGAIEIIGDHGVKVLRRRKNGPHLIFLQGEI